MARMRFARSGVEGIATRHGYRIEQLEMSLFDLDADPGESTNLADDYPVVVQELKRLAATARIDLGDSLMNVVGRGLRSPGLDDTE